MKLDGTKPNGMNKFKFVKMFYMVLSVYSANQEIGGRDSKRGSQEITTRPTTIRVGIDASTPGNLCGGWGGQPSRKFIAANMRSDLCDAIDNIDL
jgi:hypothetical protein